ncbi:hypothetical protein [Viscerimonas tarda]
MSRAIAEKVEIEKNIEYMKNLCSSFTSSINDLVLYDDLDIADCRITDSEGKQQNILQWSLIVIVSLMEDTETGEIRWNRIFKLIE